MNEKTEEQRLEAREETTTVTRMYPKGKEEHEEERISIRTFKTAPATVSVKAGATVNLGNYESGRVDVMLTLPCYMEEVDAAFAYAKEWVDARVGEEYSEMKSHSKEG